MKKELFDIYVAATRLARDNDQTCGPKNDYYITLWQLEELIQQTNEPTIK